MTTVFIEQDIIIKCKNWGEQRVNQNAGAKDAIAYQHNKLPHSSLTANRLGVIGEVAVARWIEIDIDNHQWVYERNESGKYDKEIHKQSDLKWRGINIEVRNTFNRNNPIYVKQKDIRIKALVIQTHCEMENGVPTGNVDLTGWCWANRSGRYVASKQYYEVSGRQKKPMIVFPHKIRAAA